MHATDQGASGLVVALDGPGSSGKSTVGAAVARALDYRFVDTGLLYRALTWLALERGVTPDDAPGLVRLVDEIALVADSRGRLDRVVVAGTDVTRFVRTADVDARVSEVARVPEVRAALLPRQRQIAAGGRIVVAGRDIGTVVLPDADLKLYLDASVEERARRRTEERGIDPAGPGAAAILDDLRRRDAIDSGRPVAPLRVPTDAVIIRSDGNRFEETVARVVEAVRAAEARRPANAAERRTPAGAAPEVLRDDVTPFIGAVAMLARVALGCLARVRIEGDVRDLPRNGPLIVAANHLSNADGVLIDGWLTRALDRRIHWLGKREMTQWPVIGPLALANSIHPVDRAAGDVEAFRLAERILRAGRVLMIFPEGTRSPTGALRPAKDGLALLALRTGAPILPVGIAGTDRFWPRGRSPHPGRPVAMRVGRVFTLAEVLGDALADRRAAKRQATEAIMRRIAELLPERHQGVYGGRAPGSAGDPVR